MSLLAFFDQLAESPWSVSIHESEIAYSLLESIHVWSMCLFFGLTVMFDLRLLGWTMRKVPVSEFARAKPWFLGGLILMFVSGIPLVLAESIKCLYSYAFWVKMISLLLVLIFTFTVQRRVMESGITSDRPPVGRLTALVSLVLWFGVAGGGRWIGFS
jgi:hypothetical protein